MRPTAQQEARAARGPDPSSPTSLPHSSRMARGTRDPGPREGALCCSLRSCPDLGLDSEELGAGVGLTQSPEATA